MTSRPTLSARVSLPARVSRLLLASTMAASIAVTALTAAPSPVAATTVTQAIRNDRAIGYAMMMKVWPSTRQWACLSNLWTRESSWEWWARNRWSGAYGIPQAYPAWKMARAGSDWRTDPRTQIRWGLGYISGRYRTPCGAWYHELRYGWY